MDDIILLCVYTLGLFPALCSLKRILLHSGWTLTTLGIFIALITSSDTAAVPHATPEAEVLDPDVFEEEKLNRFVHIGKANIKMGSAYITTSIEFLQVLCALEQFHKQALALKGEGHIHRQSRWLKPYVARINSAAEDMRNIKDSLMLEKPFSCAPKKEKSRKKRALFTLLKLGGMALNIGQMYAVDRKVSGLSKKVDIIASKVRATDTKLGALLRDFRAYKTFAAEQFHQQEQKHQFIDKVVHAENMVANVRFVVNQLHNGKLDSTLIGEDELQHELKSIKAQAATKQQKLPSLAAASLYSLPISYYIRENGDLHLYIEMPLLSTKISMNLYRQIPIPFRIDDKDYLFDTQDEYLLVGESPTDVFTTLSEAQFLKCTNLDGLLVCADVPTLLRHDELLQGKDRQRCTMALFASEARAVATFCTVIPPQHLEVVHHLGHNKFVMYTSKPVDLKIKCHERPQVTFTVKHVATIFMPAGCTAETRANYFYALTRVDSDNDHLDHHVTSTKFLSKVEQQTDLLGSQMQDQNQWRIESNQEMLDGLSTNFSDMHVTMEKFDERMRHVYRAIGEEHMYDDDPLHDLSTPGSISALVALALIFTSGTITGTMVFCYRKKIKALIRFVNTSAELKRLKGETRSFRQKIGAKIAGKKFQNTPAEGQATQEAFQVSDNP